MRALVSWPARWVVQPALWALLLGLVALGSARAHKPSDSYLTVTVTDTQISGRWDIALRDLDYAIGLDSNGDGRITWGELRTRHAEIAAYAAARLMLSADGRPCAVSVGAQAVDEHTDGAYTVLPLAFACASGAAAPTPTEPAQLTLSYTLFADLDPQHRGLLKLSANDAARSAIFSPEAATQSFDLARPRHLQQLLDYGREGVWHIWIGFDHILFLLALLLPAVGVWGARQDKDHGGAVPTGATAPRRATWRPVPTFAPAFWDVLRVVTAFTVAHSITLSLAALGWVSLPSRWVEASIAASVVLAALNNVFPVFHGRRWMMAFAFGLLHGFGFASVLADLGLPQDALVISLLGFNLGVEVGQLAIVAAFLPLAFGLRRSGFYRHGVLLGGSLVVAALAAVWFAERAFELKLMPF